MTKAERFEGCILLGAIGDAFGSGYENLITEEPGTAYPFGKPKVIQPSWQITDDTQLTLATIEVLTDNSDLSPDLFADSFLKYYKERKLIGVGSSILKSLWELEFGGHWSQVGRKGEYGAGNGAAMRIAPLAFRDDLNSQLLRDVCTITHQNDEAYVGAKCIFVAIKAVLDNCWVNGNSLIESIIDEVPDSRVRDRLVEIKHIPSLEEVGKLGNDGYVVNSVPLAIAAASQIKEIGIEEIFLQLIKIGGDTDTNCSMAGQIAGAYLGVKGIPKDLFNKFKKLDEYSWVKTTIDNFVDSYF